MEMITAWLISYGLQTVGGTIGAFILGWILKKIPTGKWSKQMAATGEKNGLAVTEYCAKKIPLWNKVIEPVFVDSISVILSYIGGFIVGLKKDNPDQ